LKQTKKALEEKQRKREADEKQDYELARKLMRELEDEKFAKDLERLMAAEEKKRKAALEESYRTATKLQAEEDAEFKKRIEKEKSQHEILYGPGYWSEPLKYHEKWRRVPVSPDLELYGMVETKFRESGRKISSLEYVQNPKLWKTYVEAKRATNIPEVMRFHGTPYKNVDGICAQGILTSKDVSGGGTTIWSAENPSYSVGYSNKGPAPDGTLYMFLCRVLSTTATISTVRDSAHIFPEFVIAYK